MEKPARGLCQEWYTHPVTKYILDYINQAKLDIREHPMLGESEFVTISNVAKTEGAIEALLDLEYEINTIFSEGEFDD